MPSAAITRSATTTVPFFRVTEGVLGSFNGLVVASFNANQHSHSSQPRSSDVSRLEHPLQMRKWPILSDLYGDQHDAHNRVAAQTRSCRARLDEKREHLAL